MHKKHSDDIFYTIIINDSQKIEIRRKQRSVVNVSLDDIKIIIEDNDIRRQQKAIEDKIHHINKKLKTI